MAVELVKAAVAFWPMAIASSLLAVAPVPIEIVLLAFINVAAVPPPA